MTVVTIASFFLFGFFFIRLPFYFS